MRLESISRKIFCGSILSAAVWLLVVEAAMAQSSGSSPIDEQTFKNLTEKVQDKDKFYLECSGTASVDKWKTSEKKRLLLSISPNWGSARVEDSDLLPPSERLELESTIGVYILEMKRPAEDPVEELRITVQRSGEDPGSANGYVRNLKNRTDRVLMKLNCTRRDERSLPRPKL